MSEAIIEAMEQAKQVGHAMAAIETKKNPAATL
jgi:hypothetical protein